MSWLGPERGEPRTRAQEGYRDHDMEPLMREEDVVVATTGVPAS